MPDLSIRSNETEWMDDLSRPEGEFADAYRELATVNKWLGGIRNIQRFLPHAGGRMKILDVAAGGCDIGEALMKRTDCNVVSLDLNPRGLKFAVRTMPVAGDAFQLPFADGSFDAVISSLFFHHLTSLECVRVLAEMWRTTRRLLIVNDLHRHSVAHASIRFLSALFSRSVMFRNDSAASVRRAFKPAELLDVSRQAHVPARVVRCFPYRLLLVAEK
jgi:ubiquinone/menaquinone biosynthesis C-methylase UbiE